MVLFVNRNNGLSEIVGKVLIFRANKAIAYYSADPNLGVSMEYSDHMSGLEFTALRMRKNLSQSQMATILGVSVVTIKAWERERRSIPLYINNFIRLSIAHASPDTLTGMVERLRRFSENQG